MLLNLRKKREGKKTEKTRVRSGEDIKNENCEKNQNRTEV
jgi:hypothetical protein